MLDGKRVIIGAAAAVLAATAGGCGTPSVLGDRDALSRVKRVAVLEFSGMADVDGARPGDALANAVMQRIRLDVPSMEVVERDQIGKVLAEFKLDEIGLTDGVAKLGKRLNVQAVVLGDTLQYSHDNAGSKNNPIYSVGAAMRIVDVEKGRVIYSKTASAVRYESFGPVLEDVAEALLRPLADGLKGGGK